MADKIRHLAIIVRKAVGRPYEVSFPACPRCVTVGVTLAEAIAYAREALEGCIETSVEAGDTPPPSDSEAEIHLHRNNGALVTLLGTEVAPLVCGPPAGQ